MLEISYTVLGGLGAQIGSDGVELGTRKQRATLAQLILAEGVPVRADSLIEGIWGDSPPERAEVSLHTLAAGAATAGPGDPPRHEPGSRETAVALDGRLRLVCDGSACDLDEGDTVTFDADLPHHFENPTEEEAVLLAIVSAGLRRS